MRASPTATRAATTSAASCSSPSPRWRPRCESSCIPLNTQPVSRAEVGTSVQEGRRCTLSEPPRCPNFCTAPRAHNHTSYTTRPIAPFERVLSATFGTAAGLHQCTQGDDRVLPAVGLRPHGGHDPRAAGPRGEHRARDRHQGARRRLGHRDADGAARRPT